MRFSRVLASHGSPFEPFPRNAALCNLYRDGNDSVGVHADAEPEMGACHRVCQSECRAPVPASSGRMEPWYLLKTLPHGSLLIMAGKTQKNFKHEVPKEPGVTQPRINLTFRCIEHK